MTAVASNYFARTSPNFRQFELPWSRIEEEAKRLKKSTLGVMGTLLVLSVIIPFLPVAEINQNVAPEIPPRLAKIVIEKKTPPPPPEVIPEPAKPESVEPKVAEIPKPKPKPIPVIIPQPTPEPVVVQEKPPQPSVEQAREKAKSVGLLAVADDLASLRNNSAVSRTEGSTLSAAVANGERTERSLITSKSSTRSAGVNTAELSRNTGGGGLAGRSTTAVTSPVTAAARSGSGGSSGGSGSSGDYAGQRSQEAIEMIFDRNKAAIYALYRRALRQDPTLQGKLVLQLTIAPSGKVTGCNIVSSELNAPDFEGSLIRRVQMFDFGAEDVDEITTTKPIDFFPA